MADMFDQDDDVVVVAIDFGTTYSGWAFSLRDKYKNDHLDIQTHSGWKSGDGLITPKVPTCILFDKEEKFRCFGYEAENKYAELLAEDNGDGWKYFSNFKMSLFSNDDGLAENYSIPGIGSKKISSKLMLKDACGKSMTAMKVFSESLKYLMNNFLNVLKERIQSPPMQYISWVLTVPAIWTDKAKEFMRLAALEAGISDTHLYVAYEPEAAALFCNEVTYKSNEEMSVFKPGESFLVLDCGGGTVDIVTYQVIEKGKLRELHQPSGGPLGGTMIDKAFLKFMEGIFGKPVWSNFVKNYISEFHDLKRHFEAKKRTVGEDNERQNEFLTIPRSLFDVYEELNHTKFESAMDIKRVKDKIKVPTEVMVTLFEETTNNIADHVGKLLEEPDLTNVKTVLMVGGFSDCSLLRQKVKKKLSNMLVICPDDAVLSVVKGAVIFGNNREWIQERICPRTYGIACNVPYNNEQPYASLQNYDGQTMSTHVFKTLVRKGDPIFIGKSKFDSTFGPTTASYKKATIGVFCSSEADPLFTIGVNVRELGILNLDIPDTMKGTDREIVVTLTFCKSTEIEVVAYEKGTQNRVSRRFSCLE